MIRNFRTAFLALMTTAMAATSATAQVSYTGRVYSQDFNSLPGTANATAQPWTDNATLPGWYASKTTFGVTDGTLGGTASAFDSTSSNADNVGLFNFGTAGSTDRALGSRATSNFAGNDPVLYGVRLVNNTGQTLTRFTVTYTGEQWYASTQSAAHTLLLDYQLGATSISAGTWSAVTAGTFTAPISTGSTARALNGNTTANRTVKAAVVTGVSWAPGQELWIRFRDANESGNEQGLGVDDFSFMADNETGLFFNGSTSYVTMGYGAAASSLNASSFTIECRFMRTGPGVTASTGTGGVTTALPLVAKGVGEADGTNVDANYFLGIDNATGRLVADFEQLNATNNGTAYPAGQNFPVFGSTILQNGVFYHAAATYDTATATWKLYVNGVEETTTQTLPTFVGVVPRNDNIQGLGIGTTINSTGARSGFFQGVIDEVRIWNVARTPAQILANKDLPIVTGTTGLLARYGFNEGTGTSAAGINASGAAAPVGTLSGTTLPVWSNSAALVPVNNPPTVNLTAPAAGATAVAPGSFQLTATAADSDGSVSQVEFLRDGSVIATLVSTPYNFTDSGVAAGFHTYAVRATDDSGATTTSGAAAVSVLSEAGKAALLFDGVNDYVTMGTATELSTGGPPDNGLTLECWFRKEGAGVTSSSGNGGVSGVPLFGKGRGEAENSNVDCNYFFGINSSGQLVADFEAYPAAGITAGQNYPITGSHAAIQNNVWHHAAATYNGANAMWTLYLDGVSVGTATAATGALPRYDSIQHFGIGTAMTSAGVAEGAFAGRIDEVRVWSYARSAEQIAASKDYEIASAPGLIGRYGLNEGTGTTTANNAGTGGAPAGTLTNGPIWVDGAPLTPSTPPAVTLTAPAEGATFMTGAVVSLAADATDADGISRIEFYAGEVKLGEDNTAPFTLDWTPLTPGDFTITAKAYDRLGSAATSSAVAVHIIPNNPPAVALTAPANNTTVTAPGSVNLTATASDSDGSIAKVEFYNGATKIGEDLSEPYAFTWSTIPSGDYVLTAKAMDNLGSATTSAAVTLHVLPPNTLPPVVSVTAPTDGASFSAPAAISLAASATDPDGAVAKVEFFNGLTKIGEDTTPPFTFAWSGVPVGDYTITAKATDDMTATATSTPITVHVLPNQAPTVTLSAPADNATGIGSSTNLELKIDDAEGDAQTVAFYGRRTTPPTPGADFSIIAIPDTQYYSENTARNPSSGGTGAVAAIYNAQMQWVVDNRTTRNIAFVSHMGDIAQNGDANESEWIVAHTAQKIIENPLTTLRGHGMPWGVAPGNHDQMPIGDAGGATNYFTKYFNFTRWDKRPYYGGHFGSKSGAPANTNNYELFSASGMDFIIIHLEYDLRAKSVYQPVLDWADALLKAYPERRGIVTSHWIVNTGNPASFSTQGQNIYDALKNNPNFFLMLCGHVDGEGRRADVYQGRTVYSILSDYQERSNGGNGFLRILTFKPAANQIHVESYSPTLNRAAVSGDGVPSWTAAYDLTYNMQTPITDWIPLGTVNVAAAGSSAALSWTGLDAGRDYEWYATVNDGTNTVTTAARRFSTAPPVAPTVAITSPADSTARSFNSTINIAATANDADGVIARVEFFDGGTKLGEAATAPYVFAWNGAALGSHTLTAVATDDSGLDSVSVPITINVVNNSAPTVALTSPVALASYQMPASIDLTATATDSDGTVAKVEFYANGAKVGEATGAPYAFTWSGAAAGVYALTAVATDNAGMSTTSAPVSISIATAPVNFSFTENFNSMGAAGTAPPSGWSVWQGASSPATSNTTWTSSISASGAGSVATMIAAGTPLTASAAPTANNNNGYNAQGASASDRVLATAPTTGAGSALQLSLTNTSGAALNSLTIGYDTRRYTSVSTANELPGYWLLYSLDNGTTWTNVSALNPSISSVPNSVGVTNTPATAVTLSAVWANNAVLLLRWVDDNAQQTSPDQIIGLDNVTLSAVVPSNVPPTVALTSPANAASYSAPAVINLSAEAADIDGTVSKVEFYNGATLLGQATAPPYTYAWSNVVTGTYSLTARATDNTGVSTTSAPVSVTVTNAANVPPSVAITSPAAAASFTAPASITITVNASDTDGAISKVEFYSGANLLGQAVTAPFTCTWTGVPAGNYSLTAKATDNDGGMTTSTAVNIVVSPGSAAPSINVSENFDSLGSSGTALPAGWSYYSLSGGHEDFSYAPPAASTFLPNATTTAILVGTGSGSVTANATLTAATSPASQKGTGAYNFGLNAADRCVGTSPSGNAGGEIQWSLTNSTASTLNSFTIGYDIRRFTTTTNNNTTYDSGPYKGIEELPGYWLFYSQDNGATWTNVAELNPTLSGPDGVIVPNSVGVTTIPPTTVTLASPWAAGATLLLRWFDDNAESPSPDQILGLDNVSFAAGSAVGVPPTVALTAPAPGSTYTAPAAITLTATAADGDGTVSKVEFYNGATLLGQASASPYTFSWANVSAGTYSLTARATDNDNNTTTSTAVSVTVNASGGPTSGTLTRGPYLQKASPTAMTVRWRSSQSIIGRVRYGAAAANLDNFVDETAATTEHEVRLTGLAAASTYFYSVGSSNDTLLGDATTTFATPPVAGPAVPTRVWVLGDAGTGSANQSAVRDAFYTWTGTRTPEMVLQLGDNAYNSGQDTEFQSAVFNMYSSMLRKTPFWSCLGNHETGQATSFVDTYPYFNIYSFPTAGECGGVASGTEHYYSWDYGNIHFISLDSMTASRSASGAMATWLTNDLASTTATWIICIFHHPPYTKGSHNSDSETELIEMRQNILPILEAGGVDLVLGGHSHCYERSYLLDGHYGNSSTLTASMKKNAGNGRIGSGGAYIKSLTGPRAHGGTVYCVTGSAGQISGGSLNHPAHFTSLNNLGSTVLDINGTRLDLTFLRENGSTPDTFTMIKQGGTLAPSATTLAATNVTATSATLNASVNPNGSATTAKIQSGATLSYGIDSALTLSPNDGFDAQVASATVSNLQPGATYHFRVSSTNANGTTTGDDLTFTTPKLAQVIDFPSVPNKTFGDSAFALSATGGGGSASVVFSVISGPATLNGDVLTLTGAGVVTVRASQAGDASFAAAPYVERTFSVAKAGQIIGFGPLSGRTFGDPAFSLSAAGGGSTSTVVFSVVSGPATLNGVNVILTGAGAVTLRASQAGDGNYLPAEDVERSFTVAKAAQVITFAPLADRTYGDTAFDLTASGGASTSPVVFSMVSGPGFIVDTTLTITGAGPIVVRASQAGDVNYLPALGVDRSFNVIKAGQGIVFDPIPDKVFGDAPFDISAAGGASTAPVVFSIFNGPATLNGRTVTLTGSGSVVIRASQAGDDNHEAATDVVRSFNVTKASQALTLAAIPDKTFGDAPFDLSVTGGKSTSPVVVSVVSGPVSLSGGTVTITGAGSVIIRATQAGDENYAAAESVERAFTVAKAAQSLTFDASVPASTTVFNTVTLAATSDLGLTPVTFSVASGRALLNGNSLSFTAPSTVIVQADQAGDENHLPATLQKTIEVTSGVPIIAMQPEGVIGVIGQPVSFTVTATSGSGEPTYQWKRNGVNIANAKSPTYHIPAATAASVGIYTVEVKNSIGPVQSRGAELAVVDNVSKNLGLAPGGSLALSVTAAGSGLKFLWHKDGEALSDDSHISGAATAKLTVKPLVREDAGAYFCLVSKATLGSHAGGITTVAVSTLKPEIAPIDALPDGAIGKAYSYQVKLLEDQSGQVKTSVTKFAATGLPSGLTISNAGLISGTPSAAVNGKVISITATNHAGVGPPETATLTVKPLPAHAVGTFVGRFERASGVNAGVGGRLDLTTTTAGSFTAKLTQLGINAANAVSSKGVLITTESDGALNPTGAVTFARTKKSPLSLSFHFNPDTQEIGGLLTDPDSPSDNTAELSGVHNVWVPKTHIAASYSGYYTLALDLPEAAVGNAGLPQGNGYASFTVADAGSLTWTGKTADGLASTAGTFVGPDGQVVLFAPVAATGGSLTGTALISADATSGYANNSLSGGLTWSKAKATGPTDRAYKSGFGPLALAVVGGKYTPPANGAVVMKLPNVDQNACISFAAGGLLPNQIPPVVFNIRNLTKGATQKITLPVAGSAANPAKVSFLLAAAPKGQFSGSFTLTTPGVGRAVVSRVVPYSGMIIKSGDTLGGYGYFLLPQLPGDGEKITTSPILSGQVLLEAEPAPASAP